VFAVAAASLLTAASALAGPFFTSSTPKEAAPGEVVTLRAGMGVKLRTGMPLYLIRVVSAPRPHLCDGGKGYCEPTARRAPASQPYLRIGTLNVSHARGTPMAGYGVTVRYRVPARARPGRYAYVLYCRWCGRSGEGSLIAWPTTRTSPDARTIMIGTALIVQ